MAGRGHRDAVPARRRPRPPATGGWDKSVLMPPSGLMVSNLGSAVANGAGSVAVATRPLTRADVLSAGDVSQLLGIPKSTVEDWGRRGVLPSRKRGRRRFYLRWEVE